MARCRGCNAIIPDTGIELCLICLHKELTAAVQRGDNRAAMDLRRNIDELHEHMRDHEARYARMNLDVRVTVVSSCLNCPHYERGVKCRLGNRTVTMDESMRGTPDWCPLPTARDIAQEARRQERDAAMPLHRRPPTSEEYRRELFGEEG